VTSYSPHVRAAYARWRIFNDRRAREESARSGGAEADVGRRRGAFPRGRGSTREAEAGVRHDEGRRGMGIIIATITIILLSEHAYFARAYFDIIVTAVRRPGVPGWLRFTIHSRIASTAITRICILRVSRQSDRSNGKGEQVSRARARDGADYAFVHLPDECN